MAVNENNQLSNTNQNIGTPSDNNRNSKTNSDKSRRSMLSKSKTLNKNKHLSLAEQLDKMEASGYQTFVNAVVQHNEDDIDPANKFSRKGRMAFRSNISPTGKAMLKSNEKGIVHIYYIL
jgi:spore germination protein YaaH